MTIRLRTLLFVGIGILLLVFLIIERDILAPFILAAIFAYIVHPLVTFFTKITRLPRTASVIVISIAILFTIILFSGFLTSQIAVEYAGLEGALNRFAANMRTEVNTLPYWLQPIVYDLSLAVERTKFTVGDSLLTIFPQALSQLVSVFIFLFAGFYFLKEGHVISVRLKRFIPKSYESEIGGLIQRIDTVFRDYFRGQLALVVAISSVLFVIFSILGIPSALILAIFSGFAEIIPFIGPLVAASAGLLIVFTEGVSHFPLTTIQALLLILIIYFILRQILDYLVIPHMMGKITDLHPLVILFAVLAGGHLAGILGLLLAVPVAGAIRILLEFLLEKVKEGGEIHFR